LKNPIHKSGMFVTPKDEQDLFDRIAQLTSSERQIATMFAMFTMNMCSQMVDKAIEKAELEAIYKELGVK
jgi:hypothetical protein